MRRLILLMFTLVLLLSLSYSQEGGDTIITRDGGSIVIENDNYLIDWELEISGSTPKNSNMFIIDGQRLLSKNQDRTVDIAIISPSQFTGGDVIVSWDKDSEQVLENHYYCPSSDYGWVTVGETAYCGYYDGEIYLNDTITITSPYVFDANPDNATIYWNVTGMVKEHKEVNFTGFEYINHTTIYGNHIYYVDDVTFRQGIEYNAEFRVEIDENNLPLKYTVCFGDLQTQTLYFCLDPTITTSRTWTVSNDFTNDTVTSNISTTGNQLGLSTDISLSTQTESMWFKCDGDVTDSGSLGYDLTAVGTVLYNTTNTMQGTASCQWDGAGNAKKTSGVALATGNKHRTVSAWYFINAFPSGNGNQRYFEIGNRANSQHMSMYFFDSSGTPYLRNDLYNDAVGDIYSQPSTKTWFMVTTTYNYTSKETCFWINASRIGCSEHVANSSLVNSQVAVAARGDNDGNRIEGSMDSIRYYDQIILEESEISELYNNGNPYETYVGTYSDRQGWTPQTDNAIKNISVEVTHTGTSTVEFRYNATNSSLDTSSWTSLTTNGTNTVVLSGLSADDAIYYEFRLTDDDPSTGSPLITSYTMNEDTVPVGGGDSCDTATWDATENCAVDSQLDAGGATITCTGAGQILVSADVINCNNADDAIVISGGCEVRIQGGAKLCD